jgi:uncharacterized protein DUF6641
MMIARLEEQKLLLNDPNYIRTSRTWVKKNGELTPIDRQQRVLPWWRVNADGSYVFFVRLGSKPIEFEKGKNSVAVPSFDKMPLVINILITAVRNGELDEQLAQTKKPAVCAEVPQDGVILTRGAGLRTVSPSRVRFPRRHMPQSFRALHPHNRRKQEVDMLSPKSGAPEKERNASVGAAEVMGRAVPHDQSWARSEPTTKAGIGSDMSSRSKGVKNVLSLQVARERTRQAKAASDRQISERSNQRLLERLEAENAQLRDCVVELMLEIQALHDGAK